MLKKLFAFILLLTCCFTVFGQVKPRLGILPFIGGPSRDGETITTLLSFQNDIRGAFTVVPMTNAATAMVMDQNFQMSSYPDSDYIARIGRMLNADFVVAGYIRYLGDRSLIIANVINVETFELLAGSYQEYRRLDEVTSLLPEMARTIIDASRLSSTGVPKLAVATSDVAKDVASVQEVDTLAQILAIEIDKSGKYVILPRTTTIQQAKRDLEYRTSGYYTTEEGARAMGWAVNARFILNTEVYSVGAAKMFSASIINVENGNTVATGSRLYRTIGDGIPMMTELARMLIPDGTFAAAPPPVPVPQPVPAPQPAPQPIPIPQPAPTPPPEPEPEPEPQPLRVFPPEPVPASEPQTIAITPTAPPEPEKPEKASRTIKDPARLWTVGASVGSSFAPPWAIFTLHGTIAPFKYTFLELGCDVGFISGSSDVDFYYSIYPFAHLAYFRPFNIGGWYIGAGAGYMMANYKFPGGDVKKRIFAIDLTTGVNLFNFLDVSYTVRVKPDLRLKSVSHKVSVGYTYRF